MRRRSVRAVLIIAASLLSLSCISHVRQPYNDDVAVTTAAPAGPFMTPRAPVDMQIAAVPRPNRQYYTVDGFSFAATGINGQSGNVVSGRLFSGRVAGRRPVVIVLPVWGVSEYPSKKFTRDLVRRARGKIDVMLVESQGYLIDWDALSEAATEQEFVALAHATGDRLRDTVLDIRRMVDWLSSQPQYDPDKIGIIGFSLSGVAASLAIQHEPRFAAGVIVLGGSNPAEIFAVCDGRPGRVRAAAMRRFGYTIEEYQQIFKKGLAGGDSRAYAGRVADPSRLLFIEAARDDCMTEQSRDGLWEALGRPERIGFQFRHRTTFYAMTPLGFNILGRYATQFFENKLISQP